MIKNFVGELKVHRLATLVSPDISNDTLWIIQDATFSIAEFVAGKEFDHYITHPGKREFMYLLLMDRLTSMGAI